MRIGVNARLLLPNKLEGIGRFTYETLKRITIQHPEHEFYFFFDRPYSNEFVFGNNVIPIELFPPARHPFLYYWFFHFSIKKAIKKYKIDLFLSTDGYLCPSATIPQIGVIHDLAFIHYKEGISTIEHWYYNTFFPKYAKLATKLITVSNYTKQDIITQYNIDSKKIEVIYNAPSVGFKPISTTEKKEIQNKFAQGQEYFCYVGALHPRKNIENLLLSFDVYKTKLKNNFKLIIVGRKAWKSKKIDEVFKNMTFAKDVIFTGRLNEEELNKVTASAFAMVYIPLFEGFGLPIVEAMACDVPIICSNVTSMPEVAGDAAILVSPNDINEISQAMINLTENTDLYQQKKLASAVRKKDFSWDIAAAKMWNTIEQTLEKQIE